jgi:CRP-like cAMP-binding protein
VTLDTLTSVENRNSGHAVSSSIHKLIGESPDKRTVPAEPLMLAKFSKFSRLDHNKLEKLAARSLLFTVPPGTKLLERGTTDTWNLYLLEGTLQLTAADGGIKYIEADTENAQSPVASLKPRMYTVSALTRASFIWIDDNVVDQILRGDIASKG